MEKLAIILYDMSCDMDYIDYATHAEQDLNMLKQELSMLQFLNCKCLLQVLSIIATEHDNMKQLIK